MYRLIREDPSFEVIGFSPEIFDQMVRVKGIGEIHDRIISATAKVLWGECYYKGSHHKGLWGGDVSIAFFGSPSSGTQDFGPWTLNNMKQVIYSKITYISLLLLAMLPLGSAFNLTWKELVRLFIITLGLLYLYVKYFRRIKPQGGIEKTPHALRSTPDASRPTPYALRTSPFEPLILSIVYMFLITQFDPATSAINNIIPQSRLNWFFIASSVLIFVGFVGVLLQGFGVRERRDDLRHRTSGIGHRAVFSPLDKFVLIAGAIVMLSTLICKFALRPQPVAASGFLSLVKIAEYILLYFLITQAYSFVPAFVSGGGEEKGIGYRTLDLGHIKRFWVPDLQFLTVSVLAVFCSISLIGSYRVASGVRHYKLFNKYREMKVWDKATEEYEKIIKLNFDSVNPHLRLGDLYKSQGMWEQAKKEYAKAFILSKDTRRRVVFEEWNKAIDVYKEAVKLDPDNVQAYLQLANAYKRGRKTKEAIGEYKKIIQINPNCPEARRGLGQLYLELGRAYRAKGVVDEAIIECKRAIEINPNGVWAYMELGHSYRVSGLLEKAIRAYRRAIDIRPNIIAPYLHLAVVYRAEGMIDEAIIECKRAVEIDSRSAWAYMELGHSYRAKGLSDEAINAYKRAIDIEPDLFEAYLYLAAIYRAKGELDEAITQCKKAIEINPRSGRAYEELGHSYRDRGLLEEAIGAYNQAIEVQPNNIEAYKNLVALKQKMSQAR